VAAASAAGSAQDIQNQFLTMLTTQLENQDPLNPMDNSEVTSQMAQLSTVSGIAQLNTTLEALSGQMSMSQSMQASELIGHNVLIDGGKIAVGSGVATASGVDMLSGAADVKAVITDASGKTVRTVDLGPLPAGVQPFTWDGKTDAGGTAPDGAYTLNITATDSSGAAVSAQALAQAGVESVAYGSDGPTLNLGLAGTAALSDVKLVM